MEILDLFDRRGEPLGRTIVRGENIPGGTFVKVVHAWIENKRGQFLIQQVSEQKGGTLATTGGCVSSGQTAEEAVIREIAEEIGLTVNKSELKFIGVVEHPSRCHLIYVFHILKDVSVDRFVLQEEEVASVMWLGREEIKKLMNEGAFRPSSVKTFKLF